jgi:hypothetical protein
MEMISRITRIGIPKNKAPARRPSKINSPRLSGLMIAFLIDSKSPSGSGTFDCDMMFGIGCAGWRDESNRSEFRPVKDYLSLLLIEQVHVSNGPPLKIG